MSNPTISEDAVRHAAKLSRLSLTDDEVNLYTEQLASILGYIGKLEELDVEGVRPMPHALDQVNVLRSDRENQGMANQSALANAPDADPPYFKVPKVLGDGGGA
ncbi:MAG: Asp-tRNA(Asn)/Glu-tRNA(Gln) amidotransferase subunit GatC [Planctomycetota bacterium]